ncbi:MAG: hypothetical protein ACRD2I_18350 [Vicinamibacterales bacterium]
MVQANIPRVMLKDGGRPLVLAGPPRHVRGALLVRNPGDEKVIIRQPLMRPATVTGRGKQKALALQEPPLTLRRIVVRARQDRQVPIALSLEPGTPPGTYHAQLDVDGELREVVLHVTEDVAFTIEPSELVIPNRRGEKVTKQIVVSNQGNVAIAVKTIGAIVVDEELVHCRALRGALADVGKTMKTLDDFITALGHRYHDLYDKLVLKVHNEPTMIAPGETVAIDLTISLPDKLETRGRYSAFAPISTQTLTFIIVPE